jgi:hypothetical protein
MKLTLRGKIVVGALIILIAVGVNALMWGKNLSCDWRHGFTPCELVEIAP